MPITQRQARQEISKLVYQFPDPLLEALGWPVNGFEHILGTFSLVFPDDAEGEASKEAVLTVYDRYAGEVKAWSRE